MGLYRAIFLTGRFFLVMACLIGLTTLSYPFPILLPFVEAGLVLFGVICLIDGILLFSRKSVVQVRRETPSLLSLGDDNPIRLTLRNLSAMPVQIDVIDELPEQFQDRTFKLSIRLGPRATHFETYMLHPLTRGEYSFGKVQLYLTSAIALIKRNISQPLEVRVPVYPSIIQMKKYELKTFARTAMEYGVKKVRRIGHSYEFDHIKQYTQGNDYRSINWKATGRRAQLMVNQYEDEKSQQVYCIIDKSRVMHMPFHGLSLFDYAVNAALVISNIVLGKQDKAGLITFAEKPKAMIRAERGKVQLKKILDALYNEKEGSVEANYESLFLTVRNFIPGRSLLFLYTNFESTYALHRVLPQLRRLNAQHLLVVVIFENTEIASSTATQVETLEDIYTQITSEHYTLTRIQIAQELKQHGILTLLTRPQNLTVDSINKYLELKSRGMI